MLFRSALGASGRLAAIGGVCLVVASACGSTKSPTPEPTCLAANPDATCTDPLYPPNFKDLFDNTLLRTCSNGGGPTAGCHSAPYPEAGFELDDIDTAYANILAKSTTGEPRVIPNDVKCGKVIVRLETAGEPWSMPPDDHLNDQTLCAITQWIKSGAPGP